ncbi:hypothetical protein [Streptomyces sp. NBC_00063]|uniref:hypothetical protein n=1 Tax=Streptomyces sp. NBC_00063 TaxID=2975638 RepID=UPI003D744E11
MFTHDIEYAYLCGDYFLERTSKTRATRRLVSQLNRLGFQGSHPWEPRGNR